MPELSVPAVIVRKLNALRATLAGARVFYEYEYISGVREVRRRRAYAFFLGAQHEERAGGGVGARAVALVERQAEERGGLLVERAVDELAGRPADAELRERRRPRAQAVLHRERRARRPLVAVCTRRSALWPLQTARRAIITIDHCICYRSSVARFISGSPSLLATGDPTRRIAHSARRGRCALEIRLV